MSELRVPVEEIVVQLLATDGLQYRGCVFLPCRADAPSIPIPPSEWLARCGQFFPFLVNGELVPSLLNRDHVVALSVDGALEAPPAQGLDVRRVTASCAGARFTGDLVLDVAGRGRVVDHLNRAGAFVLLREAGAVHIVRKACITQITELGKEPHVP